MLEEDPLLEEIPICLASRPDQLTDIYLCQYPSKFNPNLFNDLGSIKFKKDIDYIDQYFKKDSNAKSGVIRDESLNNHPQENESDDIKNCYKYSSISHKPFANNICLIKSFSSGKPKLFAIPVGKILDMSLNISSLTDTKKDVDNPESKLSKIGIKVESNKSTQKANKNLLNYDNYVKKFNLTSWTELVYFPNFSTIAKQYLNYFTSKSLQSSVNMVSEDPKKYIKKLTLSKLLDDCKKEFDNKLNDENLTLSDKIKNTMLQLSCANFSTIIEILSAPADKFLILKELENLCILINGIWIIKSEILYNNLEFKEENITLGRIINSRNYVLSKIRSNCYVNKKDLAIYLKLSSSNINLIMDPICKNSPSQGWNLKLDTDHIFIEKYPDIVKRQMYILDQADEYLKQNPPFIDSLNDDSLKSNFSSFKDLIACHKVLTLGEIKSFLQQKNLKINKKSDFESFLSQNYCKKIGEKWCEEFKPQEFLYIYWPLEVSNALKTFMSLITISPIVKSSIISNTHLKESGNYDLEKVVKEYCKVNSSGDYCLKKIVIHS